MTTQPFNVLFLCTGNSARSIMAEATLNHLARSSGRFAAYSAGSFPKGEPNPLALALMTKEGISTAGARSKSWDEFMAEGAPPIHLVVTVCDAAAGEACPLYPGKPLKAHWGVPDPAAVEGSEDEQRKAFVSTLLVLRRRIDLFASLPLDKLDRLALQKQITDIGQQ
jgi:arsenate reductase